tara:strand:+ start:312 stop:995 length:684 start_codon:yes stop_codon:yes gene_type:complete
MGLVSLEAAKAFAEVSTDRLDDKLTAMLRGAEDAVRAHCGRDLTDGFESKSRTYYPPMAELGTTRIALPERPVTAITSIHIDSTGYFGVPSGAFASDTEQTSGTQYVLEMEDGTTSSSGVVIKLPGILGGSATAPSSQASVWPTYTGGVKIIYTGGYVPRPNASATMPRLIEMAVCTLFREIWVTSKEGMPLESQAVLAMSYQVANDAITRMSSVQKWLSSFREASL